MKHINRNRKRMQKEIASHRIVYLFKLAEKTAANGNFPLSDRYVEIARRLSMRYLVKIPSYYKRFFCKYCYSYFYPTKTCRLRVHRGKLIYLCFNCRKYTRIPLKR
jgi:ribonuclease P protein subunit RPR2